MAGRTFLGVGNPMGDSGDDRMGNGLKGADAALQPLPFAEEEVRTVRSIFGADAKAYLRAEATKERFMAEAPGFRLLLLSTHGVIDEDDPMMSGLVFARRPGADSYERLRTHEVFDIPLAADLVVLSACEVGLGKLVNGEGLLGLGRAFQYAGARSLLVTLWSVEDRATSELMVAFFEALHARGGRPAEALRAAKLKLMRARRQGEHGEVSLAHPFFWAPFVLIGPPVLSR